MILPSEGDKAIRALRMMLSWTAKCEHRVSILTVDRRPACDKCVERDYQAALELAARELAREAKPQRGPIPDGATATCSRCHRAEPGWRYGRCPNCGES